MELKLAGVRDENMWYFERGAAIRLINLMPLTLHNCGFNNC